MALQTLCGSCGILPDEFNLSPLYRHRVDVDGRLQELDVLWPVFHFERWDDGSTDYRVRPLYRYVARANGSEEHQFVWPFGRVIKDAEETHARVFPLWSYRTHLDQNGEVDVDWHFFPFLWGGSNVSGDEDYLAFLPIYGSIPDFLTYDRYRWVLWPIYSSTEKEDMTGHMFLVFVAGYGWSTEENGPWWHRFLPFYGVNVAPGKHEYYTVLWPFLQWGKEGLDRRDPLSFFHFWPVVGWKTGVEYSSWTTLWPFFRYEADGELVTRWDGPWPFFRWYRNDRQGKKIDQWWLWPLISVTKTLNWDSTVLLWPLIWLREFRDVDSTQRDHYFLPFYWDSTTTHADGRETGYRRIFPLLDRRWTSAGDSETRVLDLIPAEHSAGDGWEENYGFLWTLYKAEHRAAGDDRVDLAAHLFTHRSDARGSRTSVPFLFNLEKAADGSGVFRLFQCIPFRFGPAAAAPPKVEARGATRPGGAR